VGLQARQALGRRKLTWLTLALVAAGTVETGAYFLSLVMQKRWVMFAAPEETGDHSRYQGYLESRDPVLGWPYPAEFTAASKIWDRTGARPSPAFDCSQPARVSLYGDSFTQSECGDVETWGNQLALRLGMRVANYGVGGYGSDQALLRFERNQADTSDVVILAHMTENILRNLTRNRDLLTHQADYAYKPRFAISASGELEHVPIPRLTPVDHLRFVGAEQPQLVLPWESFQPDGPAGVVVPAFPYTWSFLRNLGSFRFRARLAGRPEWAEFYERNHPLQGLQITAAICREFARLARQRGKEPIVLVLPAEPDLRHFQRTGRYAYEDLVTEVRKHGVPCFEFGAALMQHLGSRDLDQLFDATRHYRPEADALLAEFVHQILRSLDLPR
jgi:hypothetical protein